MYRCFAVLSFASRSSCLMVARRALSMAATLSNAASSGDLAARAVWYSRRELLPERPGPGA